MYKLSFAVVLCVVLALAQAKFDKERAKATFEECKAETGATETYDEIYKEKKVPTTDKGMCQIECILRKRGMYDAEGKFNKENAKTYFESTFDNNAEKVEKAMAIAEECSKTDVAGLNKCEAATKIMTCVKDKATQQSVEDAV